MSEDPSNDAGKQSKSAVNYGPSHGFERCGVCRYYLPLAQKAVGNCYKVKGPIKPEDWCKLWARRSPTRETVTQAPATMRKDG